MEASEIDQLFGYRNKLIILGLTGYTGSGSKSLSNILQSKVPFDIPSAPHIYSDNYFSNKKFKISEKFHQKTSWKEFRAIKVSHIILLLSLYMDDKSLEHTLEWVASKVSGVELDNFRSEFTRVKDNFHSEKSQIITDDTLIKRIENILLSGKIDLIEIVNLIKDINSIDSSSIHEFLKLVSKSKQSLSESLKNQSGAYTIFFQHLGYILRRGQTSTGPVSINKQTIGGPHFHLIPSIIYKVVNIYRVLDENNDDQSRDTRIVIEGIRNHHEIHYLRHRFPNIFFIAVHRDNSERRISLDDKYRDAADFIDSYETGVLKIEKNLEQKFWYDEDDRNKASEFWLSDVSKCIQLSDIHVFNARQSDTYNDLRAQLCWYLSLIMHPGLFPPTDHERAMNLAFQVKLNSGCISRQVGAAVTDGDFVVLSVGWNDVPKKQTPCILRSVEGCLTCSNDDRDYSKYEKDPVYNDSFKNYMATKYFKKKKSNIINYDQDKKNSPLIGWDKEIPLSYCFKDIQNKMENKANQVHTRSVHAEENALLQIGFRSLPSNSILFTTSSTCELCAKKASEMGIKTIYYVDPYPGVASSHNLRYVTSPDLKQFYGAVGLGFYKLYMPLLPMKDELCLMTEQWHLENDSRKIKK